MLQPEQSDKLGGNVCKLCAEKINAFYEFRLSYMESEKILREMLENFESNQRLTASCSDSVSSMSATDDDSAKPKENESKDLQVLNQFGCHDCGRTFDRELELRIHSHTHRKNDTPSQNNDSHNGFDDDFLLANIKSEPVEYHLDPLDWPDLNNSDLDNASMQNDDELRWKCTICDARFLRRAHLRQHRQQHAVDRSGKPIDKKIKDATKIIPHAKSDKGHFNLYKSNFLNVTADSERWQCKKCSTTFRTRRMLRDHSVAHRMSSFVPITFDNSLMNSSAASESAANDTSSMPFFESAGEEERKDPPKNKSLSSPKSHSTPLKGEARWKCPKCRKAFETPKALRKHKLANHTFEIKLNLKSTNFVSDKKSVSFDVAPKKKNLSASRASLGDRDWPCTSCHQVFQRRSMLRNHRRTVHMLKPADLPISVKQEHNDGSVAADYVVAELPDCIEWFVILFSA